MRQLKPRSSVRLLFRSCALVCTLTLVFAPVEARSEAPRVTAGDAPAPAPSASAVLMFGSAAPARAPSRFGVRNPRGPILNLQLGFANPIGQYALRLPTGFRFGVSLGYELRFGFGTVSPLINVSTTSWGSVTDTVALQVGARVDRYFTRGALRWNLWGRSLLGYGRVSGLQASHGLATFHAVGASVHFFRYLGVGLFLEASTVTMDPDLFVDDVMFSLDIGIVIHGKLPL